MNIFVLPAEQRADSARWTQEQKAHPIRLADLWTVQDGNWDRVGQRFGPPQWARDDYLGKIAAGGAAPNLFACHKDAAGRPLPGAGIIFGSDGLDKLNDAAFWKQQTA